MATRPERPRASAIVPCLNEEETIETFYERVSTVLDALFEERWEIVFVDDGSTDRTMAVIGELHRRDPRVHALRLSRNFGSHVSIAAGLDHVDSDLAIILAADLQDPPETIPKLVERWRAGFEVVWGARSTREDPIMRRIFARLFYGLIRRTALPRIPSTGSGSFCLIDRAVIESFQRFPERNRLTFGIISWSGFAQTEVPYQRAPRHAGRSKWSFGQLVKTAIDTFVSFSYLPLRLISYFGFVISILAFAFALYVIAEHFVVSSNLRGWPSLMAAILFLGGVQLLTLGVVGEYIWRISEESKRRPLYLVRERLGIAEANSSVRRGIEPGAGGPRSLAGDANAP
jgi:glycosyltransferase involved in cell wall biosynthesis